MINIFLHKMRNLWQSKNKNYKNLKDGGIAFIIMTAICFVVSLIVHNENIILTCIAKYTFRYMGAICFMISINLLNFHFYINNGQKSLSNKGKIFIIPILIFLALTLIVGIPFTVLLGIIGWVISARAKKMDNLISFIILLLAILVSVALLIYPNFMIAYIISALIETILLKYNVYIDVFPLGLFMFINLCTFEGWLVSKLFILLKKHQLNKDKSNKQKILERSFEKNIDISDIKAYVEKKSNKIIEINSQLTNEVEYDISYLINTIKRVELAILIILFIIIALKIVPSDLIYLVDKYQSDSINVITIYTLIMLYMDKRKEWK